VKTAPGLLVLLEIHKKDSEGRCGRKERKPLSREKLKSNRIAGSADIAELVARQRVDTEE
jgi:hypothetical protein